MGGLGIYTVRLTFAVSSLNLPLAALGLAATSFATLIR